MIDNSASLFSLFFSFNLTIIEYIHLTIIECHDNRKMTICKNAYTNLQCCLMSGILWKV